MVDPLESNNLSQDSLHIVCLVAEDPTAAVKEDTHLLEDGVLMALIRDSLIGQLILL